MSQNVNLSITGLNTSLNDYQGLPPGALDVADNCEIRYKNLLEPRRGFTTLTGSQIVSTSFRRLTNFYINASDSIVSITSAGDFKYYNGSGWSTVSGSYSTGITNPDSNLAKARFVKSAQSLYITDKYNVRSLPNGSGSSTLLAGVPVGLNIDVAIDNSTSSGFLGINQQASFTGQYAVNSNYINNVSSISGLAVGQYIYGAATYASANIQNIIYTAVTAGSAGNNITIHYTNGGTNTVSVSGSAITVDISNGVTTNDAIVSLVNGNTSAAALVKAVTWPTGSSGITTLAPSGPTNLLGGADTPIPAGTTITAISNSYTVLSTTGNTTAGNLNISNLASISNVNVGDTVSGTGISSGTTVTFTGSDPANAGKFVVTLSIAAFASGTGTTITFTRNPSVTLSNSLTIPNGGIGTVYYANSSTIYSYIGSQVIYRAVYGRVETDLNGTTVTRLGAPTPIGYLTNTDPFPRNANITLTLPKNSSSLIGFVQLYRSSQTGSATISPLDQEKLVFERALVAGDFTARTITINDSVIEAYQAQGTPLYYGSDQEGSTQENSPPPSCWDLCVFKNFALYGNITQPCSFSFTIVAIGAPSGIQNGDTLTIAGNYQGNAYSRAYTAAGSENQASHQFQVYTSGTLAQNIANTAASLIRVINYDNSVPVHALLLSTSTDLPGQILLQADNPTSETFTVTASAHTSAYSPALTGNTSTINQTQNGVAISKVGENESVPVLNLQYAGDSQYGILRMIPLRDYVVILKGDGVYKGIGSSPSDFVISSFDLTTKILAPDTAVSLNSAVYFYSNQGVVEVNDGGVISHSVPIDNDLNSLYGSYQSYIQASAFAIGYESDRKYILALPNSANNYASIEYCYNYVTDAWTTWSRNLYCGFVESLTNLLYIGRADSTNQSVSQERKNYNRWDYTDEETSVTITAVSGTSVTLSSSTGVNVGDILYSSGTLYSPITAINGNVLTVLYGVAFTNGAATVLKQIPVTLQWKQVFGDNPAFQRQFCEGEVLFKTAQFDSASLSFTTDYSRNSESVTLSLTSTGQWGMSPWGLVPWGGLTTGPDRIRFLIPAGKQIGTWILPEFSFTSGLPLFKIQGLSISFVNISQEAGT